MQKIVRGVWTWYAKVASDNPCGRLRMALLELTGEVTLLGQSMAALM
jgi:hypothetical protein